MEDKAIRLDENQKTLVLSALWMARDKYRENAAELRTIDGYERMADQFDLQARDVEALLEAFNY